MPCDTRSFPGAIICTRKQRRRRCSVVTHGVQCSERSGRLCDAPKGNGKTCNKPLCNHHAVHVNGKDLDYCPTHPEVIAAIERRRA